MFKKLAAAGAMAAVMGGVILGASPAQADSNNDGYGFGQSCSPSWSNCDSRPGHWHWGWRSGNGNGSGNSSSELVPIQLCDILNHLVDVTVLAKNDNGEQPNCVNGPAEGLARR